MGEVIELPLPGPDDPIFKEPWNVSGVGLPKSTDAGKSDSAKDEKDTEPEPRK